MQCMLVHNSIQLESRVDLAGATVLNKFENLIVSESHKRVIHNQSFVVCTKH